MMIRAIGVGSRSKGALEHPQWLHKLQVLLGLGLGLGDQRGTPTHLLASWDHKPKKIPQRMENSMATFFPEDNTLMLHLPEICGG